MNKDGKTALHKAAFNGSSSIIQLLLKNGADPRLVDSSGHIAMDYVEDMDAMMIMKKWKTEWTDEMTFQKLDVLLFENPDGLNPDELSIKMKNKLREFLIAKTIEGDYEKVFNLVSKGKASVETRSNEGQSLLSIACSKGHLDFVTKMLTELNPNVNTKDHKGWTPLMNAAINGHSRICRLLIDNECDVNIKNNMNMRAVDIVKSDEIKQMLLDETRKANLFNFEQMLELEMSIKDGQSFYDGKTTILNSHTSEYDSEEGNREIFKKMTRPARLSRFKKTKNKVLSRHEERLAKSFISSPSKFKRNVSSITRKLSIRKSVHLNEIKKRMEKYQKKGRKKKCAKCVHNLYKSCKCDNRRCLSPEIDLSKTHMIFMTPPSN